MKRHLFFLSFFYLILTQSGHSTQISFESLIDSAEYLASRDHQRSLSLVWNALQRSNSDVEQSRSYTLMSTLYVHLGHYDSAVWSGKKVIDSSKDEYLLAKAYLSIGSAYSRLIMFDSSHYHFKKSLDLAKHDQMKSDIFNALGVLFKNVNQYDSAIFYYIKAIELARVDSDSRKIAILNLNLANIFGAKGNFTQAKKFHQEAIRRLDIINHVPLLTHEYAVYADFLSSTNGEKDSIRFYLSTALDLAYRYNLPKQKALVHAIKGDMFLKEKKYVDAIKELKTTVELKNKRGDTRSLGFYQFLIAKSYFELENYPVALIYLDSVFVNLKAIENKFALIDYYALMSEVYEAQNKFEKALEYHKLYKAYTDTSTLEKQKDEFEQLMVRYETREKELEIERQKLTISETRRVASNTSWMLGASLLAGTFLILFLFQKNRIDKKRKELELIKNTVSVQEKVRSDIARDLHDSVGQSLIASKISVEALDDPATETVLSMIQEAYNEVRQVSHQMLPTILSSEGLPNAMEQLVQAQFGGKGYDVSFSHEGSKNLRLDELTEINVYRIAQEIINNIVKHSKADKVKVKVSTKSKNFTLCISENGEGFDLEKIKKGQGLINIEHRIQMINKARLTRNRESGYYNTIISI